ncbi:conjugal transfer protein TraG [Mucilaginibacter limnophilus]|uniref:Conjugal transfer protein TraG n=1 Tax=Mucilaginibacter limnophilus TaxID=1932778 RepID=A0A437MLJ5_9SPHI|nr:conjugal transfer protein MobC [Mucilaginibacter limnophilus]RVT98499.1 conjugal transfer protein TraG [Mucilaginibacter limnophilus]
MQTGENEQALRKIIDFTRFLSICVLVIHIYLCCYGSFAEWHLTWPVSHKVLAHIALLPVFTSIAYAKFTSLGLLLVSLLGSRGKKDETVKKHQVLIYAGLGMAIFFGSGWLLNSNLAETTETIVYMTGSGIGYLMILFAGSKLFRLLRIDLQTDIFNRDNETFPQEERLLDNPFSINLPASYALKGKTRKSWINIINPFRGTLVMGSPGAGKSYFVIRHIITQHIRKGFAMLLYDFKYDDLSRIAYNTLRWHQENYDIPARFYTINFEDLSRTHRCNPLDPAGMTDITDAMESSLTFMLGLNRDWIRKQSDFFVQSPINFVTALIWFLRKYQDGRYCTLPHVIELAQVDYDDLFALLQTEPEVEVLINPFVSAWRNEATDQLEGQIASAKISMARLASPALYYVMSGNDFTLDLNDPGAPKVICVGNNPLKQQVYGAVLSLYIARAIKLVNQKNKLKCNLVFDEFPTIYFNNIDSLIATARSNKVATTLAVQDYSQLKKDYGRDQAEVIMNIVGNVISGQVTGDTAKQLSERIGKINQEKRSVTVNSQDTSVSRSTQLDFAVPASKVATLSSGEFVGVVADNPDQQIGLKAFHNHITNDHDKIKAEEAGYEELPVLRELTNDMVMANYLDIKQDIARIIKSQRII